MRFRIWIPAVLAGAIVVVLSLPVQGHHSIPTFFNVETTISISGVLREVKIANPHASFIVEVTEPSNVAGKWVGIGANAVSMTKTGWTNETVKLGTKVTVVGNPPRREGAKTLVIKTLTNADGKVFVFGNPG